MKRSTFIPLITLILLTCSLSLVAQEKENKNTVFKLSLIPLGGGVEFRLKDSFTLLGQVGVGMSIEVKENDSRVIFPFYASISSRYYYNLNKRKAQGKKVDKFAANYVGVILMSVFKSSTVERRFSIGPVWGLQRNIGKKGYFDLNFGFLVNFMEDETKFGGQLGFGFGLAF
ncbi:MAG: hypothetical protein GTO45_29315 [Candidatus Aminicenantes bacterium]|nr:hypothetical protein [Candidatus Aminicenantes bacterium]NIM82893.1 hypothetical protein [Candidatus Aminicenantes bacterium]NIN22269.1 hypothetical protein [Candidatus Aminicenantes bacterium]NIN46037.1 hypothetical protein [Candidatus Aminicenantes bacterium]NIN88873.1 hypothetical protein [Candidatus Aminicenantes bacterium]